MNYYYETSMPFDTLRQGITRYGVAQVNYFLLQLHNGNTLIATNAEVLVQRFSINPSFTSINLTRDELYFRMGDEPVLQKAGNPNLMPFV